MASERQRPQRRAERAAFQAVHTGTTIWLTRRSGRHLYVLVSNVRDVAGTVVCEHGIVRETADVQAAALQRGDVFTFEARHVRGAGETHEFTDVLQVTRGGGG